MASLGVLNCSLKLENTKECCLDPQERMRKWPAGKSQKVLHCCIAMDPYSQTIRARDGCPSSWSSYKPVRKQGQPGSFKFCLQEYIGGRRTPTGRIHWRDSWKTRGWRWRCGTGWGVKAKHCLTQGNSSEKPQKCPEK